MVKTTKQAKNTRSRLGTDPLDSLFPSEDRGSVKVAAKGRAKGSGGKEAKAPKGARAKASEGNGGKRTPLPPGRPARVERARYAKNPDDKQRVTVHLPVDLIEQVRDAVVACSGPPLRLTLASFCAEALQRHLRKLEVEQHGGEPFERRRGELRGGRPL